MQKAEKNWAFMTLTADVPNMNPQVKTVHDMFCTAILQELAMAPTTTPTPMAMTAATTTPAGASRVSRSWKKPGESR